MELSDFQKSLFLVYNFIINILPSFEGSGSSLSPYISRKASDTEPILFEANLVSQEFVQKYIGQQKYFNIFFN